MEANRMRVFLPALALSLIATPAKAQQCDVNLLTGLDISASVGVSGIEMQVAGMAEALSSPPVVQAMTSGPRGCVGFALFLWADGQFPTLVDWRVISSPASAE
jgi:Ca-activated chloride channel homolog